MKIEITKESINTFLEKRVFSIPHPIKAGD